METPVTEIVSVRLPRVERKPRPREIAAHRLQSAIENVKTCTERAKRVEWIENIVVPVVQRIERRFPKGKTALLHEFADVIGNAQMAPFKRAE